MKTFQRVIDVLKSDLASGMSVNAIVKKTGITHNAIGAYLGHHRGKPHAL